MNISTEVLKKRDKDAFDSGFEAGRDYERMVSGAKAMYELSAEEIATEMAFARKAMSGHTISKG